MSDALPPSTRRTAVPRCQASYGWPDELQVQDLRQYALLDPRPEEAGRRRVEMCGVFEVTEYGIHPICDLFPRMPGPEFVALKKDIRENGLLEPIWLYEGKVLDGRHRHFACQEVGVEPRYRQYEGSNPLGFVISLNLNRRHLSESQRAMVAANLANMPLGGASYRCANLRTEGSNVSQDDAADLLQVSRRSVQTAAKVERTAPAEVVEAVKAGNISLNMAAQVAEMSDEEHEEFADVSAEQIKEVAKEIIARKSKHAKPKTGPKADALREDIKAAEAKGYSMLSSHARLLLSTLAEQREFSTEERDLLSQVVTAIHKL